VYGNTSLEGECFLLGNKKKKPSYSSKIYWNKLDKKSFKDALDKRIQLLN
jgi:hypothetical protein